MSSNGKPTPTGDPSSNGGYDPAEIDEIVAGIGTRTQDLVPILQAIQKRYNYLPPKALEQVVEITDITPEEITGVSTFYSQFRHEPVGRHIIKTCTGTACHVAGAPTIDDTFRNQLKIPEGSNTDPEKEYTAEQVACLGCCMLAPVVQIDDFIYGNVEAAAIPDLLRDFEATESGPAGSDHDEEVTHNSAGDARICLCSSCVAGGSREVHAELKRVAKALGLPVRVKNVACTGISFQAPMVEIVQFNQGKHRYACVKPEDVRTLLLRHFEPVGWIKRAGSYAFQMLEQFLTDDSWIPPTRFSKDLRHGNEQCYSGPQVRLVTEHSGVLNPHSLDDYLEHEGFRALEACLKERSPDEVIEEVTNSGLRGRGGGGFPTGRKWALTRASKGDVKYVICNGDEGDPGAFMDRMILESFPFRVLEGMIIAAWAIGAHEGYLYIRAEYPLATERIREAIALCEEHGYLGDNIRGSDYSLHLQIVEGAGAFVCGEETALMSAIEGGRGMPEFRPPYPAESGLWKRPTLINNVETFGLVPWILRHGADKFGEHGTGESKGTKTFALAGKIKRGGLIEVPMGMTPRQIVEDIGGGVPDGRRLKAVLVGGPSGGCVPADLCDTPVDYEALKSVGAIMGSGGLVVLDDSDCMVDIAKYFLEFTQDESCGKCTSCRIGTMRLREVLDRLCKGKGKKSDLQLLDELAEITVEGSLCGLGTTAPNPALTTLKYFRDEYEAHLNGVCPSKKCTPLIEYFITETCFGCTRCSQYCPVDAIPMNPYHHHVIDEGICTRCDICYQVCPVDAIEVIDR